jgi:hypothetical protein
MSGECSTYGDRRGVYRVFVRNPEGKKPLGRSRHRWEDNINPLNAELNPICHFLTLLGAHHILHISRVRVKTYLQVVGREAWTGLIWLRIGSGGGLL